MNVDFDSLSHSQKSLGGVFDCSSSGSALARQLRGCAIIICTLLVAFSLSSCGEKNESNSYLGIILGNTPNSPNVSDIFYPCEGDGDECRDTEISTNILTALQEQTDSCKNGFINSEHFEFYNVNPAQKLLGESKNKLKCDAKTLKRQDNQNKENKKKLKESIDEWSKPDYDGADYFGSIMKMANDFVDKCKDACKKQTGKNAFNAKIFVLGSGLSDFGDLNFAQSAYLYESKPNEIVESLIKSISTIQKTLENRDMYKNITIEFAGLGRVISPQPNLKEEQVKIVKEIYRLIFEAIGFQVKIDSTDLTAEEYQNSIATDNILNVTPIAKNDPIHIIIGEGVVKFKPNSPIEFDASTPSDVVKDYIKRIAELYHDRSIGVIGYVADTGHNTEQGTRDLSQGRADTIRSIFIDTFGFSPTKITAIAGGIGKNPQKDYSESELAKNRYIDIEVK